VRELEPGEMVGHRRHRLPLAPPLPAERIDPTLCLFEFVYFARPDAELYGRSVAAARVRMGEQLAEQAPSPDCPPPADMVMPVPRAASRPRRASPRSAASPTATAW
jgi:amidophosphoribosyltransferase